MLPITTSGDAGEVLGLGVVVLRTVVRFAAAAAVARRRPIWTRPICRRRRRRCTLGGDSNPSAAGACRIWTRSGSSCNLSCYGVKYPPSGRRTSARKPVLSSYFISFARLPRAAAAVAAEAMASFNEDPADRAAELERMLVGHDCTLETAFGFYTLGDCRYAIGDYKGAHEAWKTLHEANITNALTDQALFQDGRALDASGDLLGAIRVQ